MKKFLAFCVLLIFVACKPTSKQEREILLKALQSSTEMIEENNQHSMRGFDALHAENPTKTKKIYDLVRFIQDESDALKEIIQPDTISSKTALQLYEVYKSKIAKSMIYDIEVPCDTLELIENPTEMKALIANRLATFKALVFDKINEKILWCGPQKMVVYGENVFTENDSTIVDLDIFFPAYKIELIKLAIQQSQDSVSVAGALKVDSKFSTLRFPKLAKGKYEVDGMLEFAITNGLLLEENLYCRFEVK